LVSIVFMGAIAVLDAYYVFGQLNVDLNAVCLLGELASIFIVTVAVKYIIEERGKRTIRSTFAKYLAPEVVDEMLQDPDNLKLGGETRQLTIMMSDLRGFTATAERLEAAAVLEMLNHYLGTMADIIVDYRGTIDEFIGDAILVIFGAPIERPDDARRAVACCLAMQKAMDGVNAVNAAKGLPKLEMGIALNTGEVTVGNIGSERRLKYGVVGSHVNLTARIESNTVGGQLLISESTLKLAGADIKLGEKYSIIAKGFPQPVVAYEVLGIGGEHGIYLDEVDLGLTELSEPREVRFRTMKSKNDEGPEQTGELTALSELGGVLNVQEPIEALANLKLQLWTHAPLDGDVYAKVVASGTVCKLRFTNLPPAVESHLRSTLGKSDGERAAELLERS
jgi:adenylate cyclase